jgi:hypothetical protein
MKFLQEWYRRCITSDQILTAFSAWGETEWEGGVPSLVFTRPDYDWTPFSPPRTVEIVRVDDGVAKLRLEVRNNLGDPWYSTVEVAELPQFVGEFLRISGSQEEIYVTLGPNIRLES